MPCDAWGRDVYYMHTARGVPFCLVTSTRGEFCARVDLRRGRFLVYTASGRAGQHRTLHGAELTVERYRAASGGVQVYRVDD